MEFINNEEIIRDLEAQFRHQDHKRGLLHAQDIFYPRESPKGALLQQNAVVSII